MTVFGSLTTSGASRYFVPTDVQTTTNPVTVSPMFMNNKAIGGEARNPFTPGVFGGVGLNNVGLLVATAGIVTSVSPGYFYINDGSGLYDGTGNLGVRVFSEGLTNPGWGEFAIVTGTVANPIYVPTENAIRLLIPRRQSDIAVVGNMMMESVSNLNVSGIRGLVATD